MDHHEALSYGHEIDDKKTRYAVFFGSTILGLFIATTVVIAFVNGLQTYRSGLFILGVALLGVGAGLGILGRWSYKQGGDESYIRNVVFFFVASVFLFSIAMYVEMYSLSPSGQCERKDGAFLGTNENLPGPYTDGCIAIPSCFGSTDECLIWGGNSVGYMCCPNLNGTCTCLPSPAPTVAPTPSPTLAPTAQPTPAAAL